MHKTIYFLFTFLVLWMNVFALSAQQVTVEVAKEKAATFFSKPSKSAAARRAAPRKTPRLVLANNRDEFFIFNDEANGGFVIVSGDEQMPDVFGYSYDGHFDAANVPCNMEAMLEGYAKKVRSVRTHPAPKKKVEREQEDWESDYIEPLLKTTWSQSVPYNNQCPIIDGQRCLTGCVATAMAQVLAYHQWPLKTTKTIPQYHYFYGLDEEKVEPAIEPTTIDWANMIPHYSSGQYTNEQAEAVATLMKLCGSSVWMMYGPTASSSTVFQAELAFKKYFDYDIMRDTLTWYSKQEAYVNNLLAYEWEFILYNEIAQKRPILCSVPDHAVVIDGYEGYGEKHYFHVNFGWGGLNDSYYLLSSDYYDPVIGIQPLNPDSQHAYGILNNGEVTLYYDNKMRTRSGTAIPFIKELAGNKEMTKCVVDPSFKKYLPYSLESLFKDCSNLREFVGLENLNTVSVFNMSSMFQGCSSLTNLNLSSLNTKNVKEIDNMFYGCSSLTSLDLSHFDTHNVTSMNSMFSGCSSLTSLDLSHFDTHNVTSMNNMFSGCSSLTSLDLSHFDTYNVTNMDYMFHKCSSLTGLDLSGFITYKVKRMVNMFADCSSLTVIYVSDGWNTGNVEVATKLFNNCWKLVGGASTPYNKNHTGVDYAHIDEGADNPGYLTYKERTLILPSSAYGILDDGLLTLYYDDKQYIRKGTVTIPIEKLSGVKNMTKCVIDPSFKNYIGAGNLFKGCANLRKIDGLENLNTASLTSMNSMFYGCSSLTSLDLSHFDTQNVTDMGGMFYGCSSLTTLDLSAFTTQNVTSMKNMFSGCSSLTTIYVSDGWITEEIEELKQVMFYACEELVGGASTPYNKDHTGVDYAHIDGGPDNPGYLTYKANTTIHPSKAYGILEGEQLTLFYDDKYDTRSGLFINSIMKITENKEITKCVIDPSFKDYIGSGILFKGCANLREIDGLENLNTASLTSMNSMFYGCSSLKSLDLSHFDTQNVTDMGGMFYGCSSLTTLDLSHFDTRNVTYMSSMFYGCSSLTSLDVSSFNTKHVKNMFNLFCRCSSLTSLDLSHFDTHNAMYMNSMFGKCSSLTSLNLSSFDTERVTEMIGMFADCSSLTTLDLSHFDTQNVTNMRYMFEGCSALTNLNLSSFDTKNVREMEDMFHGCSSLTNLDLSHFDTHNAWNMSGMFSRCSSLKSLDLSSFNTQNVEWMFSMFEGCSALTSLKLNQFDTQKVTYMYRMFYGCSSLMSLDLSHFDTHNATSMSGMFYGCSSLTTLDLSHFNTQNATSMIGMFADCSSLTSLDLSHFNTQNATSMSGMFLGCSSLTSIDLSHFDTQNVTDMSSMFSKCSSLTTLDLSHFDTQNVTNMSGIFLGCSSLTSIDLSHFDTQNATSMGNMFSGCSSLTSIDLSHFDTQNVTDMSSMFSKCSSLTTLDLSHFDTQNVTNMSGIFLGCSSLTSIDLSHFDTQHVSDMSGMFYGCSSLTILNLSSFDTKNVQRMDGMFGMFENCSSLTTIYVYDGWSTENVTDGTFMFNNCKNLIGGASTKYSRYHLGVDYAHVDGGPDNPGYLTYMNPTAVHIVKGDGNLGDIYSISGVKIRSNLKDLNNLKPGLYVVNGKKLMAK